MPEFIIVQCYKCDSFQVCQRRKDSKFSCKICRSSQSVRRIFAKSFNAAHLRPLVQQANLSRGNAEQFFEETQQQTTEPETPQSASQRIIQPPTQSRWKRFAEEVEAQQYEKREDYQSNDDGDDQIVTSLPDRVGRKKRKLRNPHQPVNENNATRVTHTPSSIGGKVDDNKSLKNFAKNPNVGSSRWHNMQASYRNRSSYHDNDGFAEYEQGPSELEQQEEIVRSSPNDAFANPATEHDIVNETDPFMYQEQESRGREGELKPDSELRNCDVQKEEPITNTDNDWGAGWEESHQNAWD